MLWFKVFLADVEISKAFDKKLLVDFLKLLIESEFPPGLAVYTVTIDPEIDNLYLFSTPKEYFAQLTDLFLGLKHEEILQPDMSTLKLILGNFQE